MENVLEVKDLFVTYHGGVEAVSKVSFQVKKGETLGIIGESGSGKSSIALAVMGLLTDKADTKGEILYEGTDLNSLKDRELNFYRWNKVSMVFQNSLDILNPVLDINTQIAESIIEHKNVSKLEAYRKSEELLKMVGLQPHWGKKYPHMLSGGMRQRVLIAMALACDPELLLVDEPTTALDPVSKNEIVNLIGKLQKEKRFSMIVISHDLSVINTLCSKIEVLYRGNVLEEGIAKEILDEPAHTYTRGLIYSSLELNVYQDLWGIRGVCEEGKDSACVFYSRCNQRKEQCSSCRPILKSIGENRKVACNRGGIITLLEAKNVKKTYIHKDNPVEACKGCSVKIRSGEIVSLIGQSGSGKTTFGKILCGLLKGDSGSVIFEGEEVKENNVTCKKKGIQMVFQDPLSSTNGKLTVEEVIREPLDILKDGDKEYRKRKVMELLEEVQLPKEEYFLSKKCNELSGGQRQRIAIARSLILEPKVLIADEISSMLDPSTKANITRLLKELQNRKGFSILYITHDLYLARKISDRVLVMTEGKVVEQGNVVKVFQSPREEYTKKLIVNAF